MDHTRREIPLTLVAASVAPLQPTVAPKERTCTSPGLSLSPVLIAVADLARRGQLAKLWRQEGYSVSTMASGAELLEQLADTLESEVHIGASPALLILDSRLRGVLGSSIARGIRELGWTTPIVLLGDDSGISDTWTAVLPASTATRQIFLASKALAIWAPAAVMGEAI